jgi:hypothetical protein
MAFMASPQDSSELDARWKLKRILYTDPGGKWSLAEGVWKNESKEQEVVAYRWNEDNDHAKGTWFVLPKLIADAFLLQLIPE